jgi:hypothetical protein
LQAPIDLDLAAAHLFGLQGIQAFLAAHGLALLFGCDIPGLLAAQGLQSLHPTNVPPAAAVNMTALANVIAFFLILMTP